MDELSFKITRQIKELKLNENNVSKEERDLLNNEITKKIRKNISNELLNYNKVTELSYKKIATMLGYESHSSVSNIINENTTPSLEELTKISVLTGKSLDELVFGSKISEIQKRSVVNNLYINNEKIKNGESTCSETKQANKSIDSEMQETVTELNSCIEILYKVLRKHNKGALFYVADDYISFLKHIIKENNLITDLTIKTSNIIQKLKEDENINVLKSSEDCKDFKNRLTSKQVQEIEDLMSTKKKRTLFNDFIYDYIYDIIHN